MGVQGAKSPAGARGVPHKRELSPDPTTQGDRKGRPYQSTDQPAKAVYSRVGEAPPWKFARSSRLCGVSPPPYKRRFSREGAREVGSRKAPARAYTGRFFRKGASEAEGTEGTRKGPPSAPSRPCLSMPPTPPTNPTRVRLGTCLPQLLSRCQWGDPCGQYISLKLFKHNN